MAYDSGDKLIKKIQVDSTTIPHEIDAKYFNGHKWSEVTALVAAGFTIETPWTKTDYESTTAPAANKLAAVPAVAIKYNKGAGSATGTLAASGADTKKHIYLIYHPHSLGLDSYDEYVSVGTGDAAKWELIGNTDIDLSSYAKKGTYTSGGPSSNATGSAGAATITSSSAGSQTATGTASVSYQKSAAETDSANGSTASDTGEAGGVTISGSNFKFNGTQATITLSNDAVSIPSHEYTPEGSIGGSQAIAAHTHTVNVAKATVTNNVTGTATGSAGAHTHSVSIDSHTHSAGVEAYTSLTTATISVVKSAGSAASYTGHTFSAGSLPSLSKSDTDVLTSATVTADGILKWNTGSATKISSWSAGSLPTHNVGTFNGGSATTVESKTVVTGGTKTAVAGSASAATISATAASAGGHTHSLTNSSLTYVTGATVSSAGAVTVSGSNFSFAGTAATLTHDDVAVSVSGTYTPAGTISGSQTVAAHSHSYNAPAAHTHSIALSTATATGSASVAVSNHTHTITIANHTHTLGNHTHNTTI